MGDNNWLLVKFQVKDPKSTAGAQGSTLSKTGESMKDERRIDCPHCVSTLCINSGEEENVWFDTGDEVLLLPREMLEYIEGSQGLIGIT